MLLVAAVALAASAIARAWFSVAGVAMGTWGVEICDHGCYGVRWDNVGDTSFDIVLSGYTATIAGLLGALLVVIGLVRPANRAATRHVLQLAFVAMLYFATRGLITGGMTLGWAVVVGPVAAGTARYLSK